MKRIKVSGIHSIIEELDIAEDRLLAALDETDPETVRSNEYFHLQTAQEAVSKALAHVKALAAAADSK